MLKPAKQKDTALLKDIRDNQDRDGISIWWLGQSGFLIRWQGRHLLFDPYLSDSLTRKYANSEKPHVRITELVIDPARLDFIDVVTSSHNHTDHLDGETLIPLISSNPGMKIIIPEANRAFVADRLQIDLELPIGLNAGEEITVKDFTIHAVPAAHETLEQDDNGNYTHLGYVARFGKWTIYHSGDTIWYPELESSLAPYNIDIAMLPINGRAPERKVAGNFNAQEAVDLAKSRNIGMVIPCHYDMFTFNTADPQAFIDYATSRDQNFTVLENGEGWHSR